MNVEKMMTLIHNSNVNIILFARKNIMKMRKFKKLIIFKMIFKKSKKILKSNNFWIKDVVETATFRRKKSNVIIYKMKIKSIFLNIKNKETKTMQKINNIMHLRLQMKKWNDSLKKSKKKKYTLMIIWMREAKIANNLIQLKLIIKLNIKTIEYYKRSCKIKQDT